MKAVKILLTVLCCSVLLAACGKGQKINGHNTRTAYRSVKMLKERLPADTRVPFEVSFWTIRDANKTDQDFLDKVDGKTPNDIIAMGQDLYQQRKNSGYPGYDKYSSWEDMISKYNQERSNQDAKQGDAVGTKEGARDKANDVLYNLQ